MKKYCICLSILALGAMAVAAILFACWQGSEKTLVDTQEELTQTQETMKEKQAQSDVELEQQRMDYEAQLEKAERSVQSYKEALEYSSFPDNAIDSYFQAIDARTMDEMNLSAAACDIAWRNELDAVLAWVGENSKYKEDENTRTLYCDAISAAARQIADLALMRLNGDTSPDERRLHAGSAFPGAASYMSRDIYQEAVLGAAQAPSWSLGKMRYKISFGKNELKQVRNYLIDELHYDSETVNRLFPPIME